MAAVKTLNTNTLNHWLQSGKDVSIIDIRPVKERAEWFIPQSLYFNAYDNIKAKAEDPFKGLHLQKDIPVVVVCASGKTSLIGAEILRNQGYEVYSLEGGMKHWTLAWNTAEISFDKFKIIQLRRTGKGCLSYIIASDSEAVIVDASLPVEVYEEILAKYNLTLKFVTESHIHADHLSRSRQLAEKYKVPLLLPTPNNVDFKFEPLKVGIELSVGNVQIKPIATPGHTLESVTLMVDNKVILTGDTLFIDGVGRPDLKTGEEEALYKAKLLYQSLKTLISLPDHLIVLPAHTSKPVDFDKKLISGTIGEIEAKIPLLSLGEDEFAKTILQRIPQAPENYLSIIENNLKGDFAGIDAVDLEAGANRCAVS